jgi:RNA polymerase sigma-70 factor (ECF subfamily)
MLHGVCRHLSVNARLLGRLLTSIFLCDCAPEAPHRGSASTAFVWPELLDSMVKDDIVALLPDLRAFARFMCREREAADDLVQNTILAALDKQAQFEPGTNLKGWLFTIMRNRFYSDLRAQRRRPTAIEDVGMTPIAAVDNPEATLQLKELSSALWKLSPQAREALILVGAGGFSYEEAARLCDCSVGTLKARVSRARKVLSDQMR